MIASELIKQIRGLELKAGHLVTDALAGNYLSAFKGQGMEFEEVREYVPGDDIRSIDWNVTARMQAPYVKVLREERELTLMLMVDVSPSQVFGTAARGKQELSAELAALLAFLAIRNNDKVGLIVFSDHVEQYIPPKKGRSHVWNIIRSVLTHDGSGAQTDISQALEYMTRVSKRRSMVFLISDFWSANFAHQLRLAARRHDLVCVRTQDPQEVALADAGLVEYRDAETGSMHLVDTSSAAVRTAFSQAAKERHDSLSSIFRKARAGTFMISPDVSVATPLLQYFRERERRQRR
jgi:uncharacterized protein (DUF58 family)